MRGGYVYPIYQQFYYAGQSGVYWSSQAYSDTNYAYSLSFGASGVNPSDYYSRYTGRSLRCLVVG